MPTATPMMVSARRRNGSRQGSRHRDDGGADPSGDYLFGPAKQGNSQGAGPDEHGQGPWLERQEDQVDQAQGEAHQGGLQPGHRRTHAAFVAVPVDEHRGDQGPQAADNVVGFRQGVHVGTRARDKPVGEQARGRQHATVQHGYPDLCPSWGGACATSTSLPAHAVQLRPGGTVNHDGAAAQTRRLSSPRGARPGDKVRWPPLISSPAVTRRVGTSKPQRQSGGWIRTPLRRYANRAIVAGGWDPASWMRNRLLATSLGAKAGSLPARYGSWPSKTASTGRRGTPVGSHPLPVLAIVEDIAEVAEGFPRRLAVLVCEISIVTASREWPRMICACALLLEGPSARWPLRPSTSAIFPG
jgi:hypothetical protein